ncbi:transposon Ty3-G Gag-Pol polyprotein [Nephila pilipes]|uniref:Transposon Ty3-G Gag-Pol polyprotein n=1 Tax=Nephila pilipes TaxID=299642 RepID=A0A8X6T7K9_NEPPI|nr:transposon Ty3-G Gag-Pol polyprotein [Nephila pilipes]
MSSSHIQSFCPKEREPISQSEQQENEIVVGTSHSQCSNSTILQTCNVLASSENKTLNIRILLDSGSERTFILREVAEALNLEPIRKERLLLYSFGKKNPEPSNFDLVQLQLKNPHNPNHRIPIEALITQHISGASLDSRFLVNQIKMLTEVGGLEPADSGKGKIQHLLGMDFFCEVIRGAPVRITKSLFAQKSLFGNIICGALPNMTSNKSSACFLVSVEDDLNQHLRTLWEIESIGCDTAQETKHDSEFIKEFENNLTFVDGRYETKLLWNLSKTHLKQLAEFEKKKEERQARPLENQRAEALPEPKTESSRFEFLEASSCSFTTASVSTVYLRINGIFGKVCADTGSSHSIAGETLYTLLKDEGAKFQNGTMCISLADGQRSTEDVLITTVTLEIEGRKFDQELIALPNAKRNRTLLGIDFLKKSGIMLDLRNQQWFFADMPQKQFAFGEHANNPHPVDNLDVNLCTLREEGRCLNTTQKEKLVAVIKKLTIIRMLTAACL